MVRVWRSARAFEGMSDLDPLGESPASPSTPSRPSQPRDTERGAASGPVGSAHGTNMRGKIKLSLAIDQQDDTELTPPAGPHAWFRIEIEGLQNYLVVCLFAPHGSPTPKLRRWVVLHYRIYIQQASPYADFAVWLPHAGILGKELKYQT